MIRYPRAAAGAVQCPATQSLFLCTNPLFVDNRNTTWSGRCQYELLVDIIIRSGGHRQQMGYGEETWEGRVVNWVAVQRVVPSCPNMWHHPHGLMVDSPERATTAWGPYTINYSRGVPQLPHVCLASATEVDSDGRSSYILSDRNLFPCICVLTLFNHIYYIL